MNKDIYIPDSLWHEIDATDEPAFENSWVNYGGGTYDTAAFRIDAEGWVHLKGLVKSGTSATTMFTLPEGYRPPTATGISPDRHGVTMNEGTKPSFVKITQAGEVSVTTVAGTTNWASLSGIQFPVGPREGWDRRNLTGVSIDADANSEVPHMTRRRNGFTVLNGVVDAEPAGTIPFLGDLQPDYSINFPIRDSTSTAKRARISRRLGYAPVGATTNYGILDVEWGLPENEHKWIDATMLNSWVAYGQTASDLYLTGQYMKDEFGFVHLRGFIKSGSSATATMFTLPEGYRPAMRQIFSTWSQAGLCRMDVRSTGTVSAIAGGSTSWCDISNIHFYAEG